MENEFHYTRKDKAYQTLRWAGIFLVGCVLDILADGMKSMLHGHGLFTAGALLFFLAAALYTYFYDVDDIYVFTETELVWKRNGALFKSVPWSDVCGTGTMSLLRNDPHARPLGLSVSSSKWVPLRKMIHARISNHA